MSKATEWVDIVAIGSDPRLIARVEQISKVYSLSFKHYNELLDVTQDYMTAPNAKVILLNIPESQSADRVFGDIQAARQAQREGFLVSIIGSRLPPDETSNLKKNGTDFVFIANEAYYSSVLEYIVSQKVRSIFIPIKAYELSKKTAPDFKIHHVMPLNQKFLPIIHPGQEITETKYEKMTRVGELYVLRSDLLKFQDYVSKYHSEGTAEAELARCRSHFISLSLGFTDLVLVLMDESESKSFDAGKVLYEKVISLAKELVLHLDKSTHPWDIINQSSIGDFGTIVRAPAIAAYAGLMSKRAGIGNPLEVMIAALLADIGMLELSAETTTKVHELGEDNLPSDCMAEYRLHPIKSLNVCLNRRLPLPESVKNFITCSHEKTDGSGYPAKIKGEKIPIEAQLIHFCQIVDSATMIKMGRERHNWKDKASKLFSREYTSENRFSFLLMEKIRSFFE